jgi:hypothetical protein
MEEIFKGRLKNHNIAKSKQIDPYLNLFRQSLEISQYVKASKNLLLISYIKSMDTLN